MRIPGHGLMNEGAAFDDDGVRAYHLYATTGGIGRAKCECGEMSPVLPSAGARQNWHRETHKASIVAGMDAATNDFNDALDLLGPPPGWKP